MKSRKYVTLNTPRVVPGRRAKEFTWGKVVPPPRVTLPAETRQLAHPSCLGGRGRSYKRSVESINWAKHSSCKINRVSFTFLVHRRTRGRSLTWHFLLLNLIVSRAQRVAAWRELARRAGYEEKENRFLYDSNERRKLIVQPGRRDHDSVFWRLLWG